MGNLTMERTLSAVATLDHVGVFILGGEGSNSIRTSEFLSAGSMEWQEGPGLPVNMRAPCAVAITTTSFLAIHENNIHEFDVAIAGPTSGAGWRKAEHWPLLKISRTSQAGCAKLGQKVIIAGGDSGLALSSTEVLDLLSRRVSSGGMMATQRYHFHLATMMVGGQEKVFAVGGCDRDQLNSVEEWDGESSTWKPADNLVEKRDTFGLVALPKKLICPP